MKRKIVIGLAIYSVVFLLAGVYVIRTIRTATTNLDRLITLHQVEILREHYLLEIKRVQSDLTLDGHAVFEKLRYRRDARHGHGEDSSTPASIATTPRAGRSG